MSHNVIISNEEYLLLHEIAKLAPYVGEDDADEIKELVVDRSQQWRAKYSGSLPQAHGAVSAPVSDSDEELIAHAKQTAKGLMSIGINGPRLGAWPIEPSNLMCRAAQTINVLLAERARST